NSIIDAATLPYVRAGRFVYHFVRGKLRYDPVYRAILKNELLPNEGRLIDLGCGLGILSALLTEARNQHQIGNWNPDWSTPPQSLELHGVELLDWKVEAARQALGNRAVVYQGDIRTVELPDCSAVIILDVLMYLNAAEQRQILQRIARTLQPGATLLLREGDATGGLRYHVTSLAEHICCLWRGQGWQTLHYRSTVEWIALLEELGFSVDSLPMSQGTPFSNVLFHAKRVS
ncbi:MAG TPA: methyltransferase domain-containing protein, partial [Gallionellaceae bacterium]|nr:methyltransferase domain-containing protein [Gallionellaceae bacterium]